MSRVSQKSVFWAVCLLFVFCVSGALAQDWPQWLGANRDCTASGFKAPQTWPATLKQAWKAPVGQGCSSPVLVGDKLYVFSRVGDNEVLQCLNAATGLHTSPFTP